MICTCTSSEGFWRWFSSKYLRGISCFLCFGQCCATCPFLHVLEWDFLDINRNKNRIIMGYTIVSGTKSAPITLHQRHVIWIIIVLSISIYRYVFLEETTLPHSNVCPDVCKWCLLIWISLSYYPPLDMCSYAGGP